MPAKKNAPKQAPKTAKSVGKETAVDAVVRLVAEAGKVPAKDVKAALVGKGILTGQYARANAGHKIREAVDAGLVKRDGDLLKITSKGKAAIS